ncbi:MAG: PepSY domain-containing protein, partial [Planctomycetota bacterium]
WGSVLIAVPTLLVLLSGLVLQLKKEFAWIQPSTRRGTQQTPQLSFDEILMIARSAPQAAVTSWDDIDRLDVRPGKGVLKVRCKNRWEIQIDSATGSILQTAYRRSDLIESLHDGSFFGDIVKLGIFLPSAITLLLLWVTGLYLFAQPYLAKRKNKKRKATQSS